LLPRSKPSPRVPRRRCSAYRRLLGARIERSVYRRRREGPKVRRLTAEGNGIRNRGSRVKLARSRLPLVAPATVPVTRQEAPLATRNRWFESGSLPRGVCKRSLSRWGGAGPCDNFLSADAPTHRRIRSPRSLRLDRPGNPADASPSRFSRCSSRRHQGGQGPKHVVLQIRESRWTWQLCADQLLSGR
jgi:hypothetical protein